MRKYLALLLLFLLPKAPAQRATFYGQNAISPSGSIAFVQEVVAARNPSSVTTASFSCTTGDFLYIYAGTYSSTDTFTVTNTTGDTVSSLTTNKPTGGTSAQVYTVSSCTGTTGTYTLTDGNGSYLDFVVLEFSGVHGVDNTNNCAGGGWTAGCSITTVSTNTYILASMQTNNLGPINLATGWTSYQSTLNHEATVQGMVNHTGPVLVSWFPTSGTLGGGTTDAEIMVALK